MSSTLLLQDHQLFKPLSFHEDANDNIMASAGVSFATASELRVGKYCLIQAFPCRIRDIQRSAPGKHGHAKLRVVGVGIWDDRKRETIFSAHQQVLVPKVETKSNILGKLTAGGFQVVSTDNFPSFLAWTDEENKPQDGSCFLLTVVVACGHFRVTAARAISEEEAAKLRKEEEGTKEEEATLVLSKKEQRKLKRVMKKRTTVAAVVG